jgi:hypothetical protein
MQGQYISKAIKVLNKQPMKKKVVNKKVGNPKILKPLIKPKSKIQVKIKAKYGKNVLFPQDPNRWGPPAWEFLFCCAFSYPKIPGTQDKKSMKIFLDILKKILPCHTCRINYKKKIKFNTLDGALRTRQTLVKWLLNVKNSISKSSMKKTETYQQLCKRFNQ